MTSSGRLLHRFPFERHASRASGVAFSPNSQLLALATDAQVQLRRVRDGGLLFSLENGLAQRDGLVFSDDGQNLITVSPDAVRVWRIPDGALLRTLHASAAAIYAVALAPDGQALATVTDQTIQVWRVRDETLLDSLDVAIDINSVALACGGGMLAVASDDAIQVWQAGPIAQRYTIEAGAQHLVFDATGELLVSTKDSTIQIWNVRDGSLLHTLSGHTDCVSSIAFSRDGRRLISGSYDGTMRLWNCKRKT
jgi:WD40 repeat protein